MATDTVADLEARIEQLERRLRGEPGTDPIELDALPRAALYRDLENNWQPEGLTMLQRKSITAEEIGQLPGAHVCLTANLPIPNAAFGPIAFPVPSGHVYDYDNDNMNGSSAFTIQTPGIYLVTLNVNWAINGAGNHRIAEIAFVPAPPYVGNRLILGQVDHPPNAVNQVPTSVVALQRFAAGDFISPIVYQDSGGPLNLLAGSQDNLFLQGTNFAAQWVGS